MSKQSQCIFRVLKRPIVDRILDNSSEYQRELKRLTGTVRAGGGRRILRKKSQEGNY